MRTIVNGRNITLTQSIKDYIEEKLQKLQAHYDFVQEVHVFLSVEKNPRIAEGQKAEATVHVNGGVLRLEAQAEQLYASIDGLVEKADRSLQKYKTKLLHRSKSGHQGALPLLEPEAEALDNFYPYAVPVEAAS